MIFIRIIDIIGYSGSGKTFLITEFIKLLKKNLNYNVAVLKNVKHHPIDRKGKDSFIFRESGATYSVIQNKNFETGIFFNLKDLNIENLLLWLEKGPNTLDLLLTEGFRILDNPAILCVSNLEDIEGQLTERIKIISGIICSKETDKKQFLNIPIIDIKKNFLKFLEIFDIE